ncbi:sporadically distributed protein, TIGR04141 family [Nannocystis exedens]|uniref:Sporadically distributed protein, TIGR04141 family n=1 Tax=Nannocystis exedens TaxID=54 RepID=A0A1I2IGG6_9BACT|nr:DUF6119 family protein [Nannocystis exedens]PCC68199.1 hypothetical protein NAEX_01209 [Nannocystis exedens]SFF39641.1 sporadically distributed protein, TIGR04141 family [Nannocystis exedens]
MRATIYLLKKLEKDQTTEAYLAKPPKKAERVLLGAHTSPDKTYCEIHALKRPPQDAKWSTFIPEPIRLKNADLLKQALPAVLIVARVHLSDGIRYFALSLGLGHLLVDSERIERGFGKITTLNSIEKVKLANAREIGVNAVQKRLASNSAVDLDRIGIQFDSEVLLGVSGACAEEALASRVGGDDGLQITAKISLDNLGEKCRKLYEKYQKDTFRVRHPRAERIKTVRDEQTIKRLNAELINAINERRIDTKISAACPDQIDYEKFDDYYMSGMGDGEHSIGELTLENLYEALGERQVTLSDLLERIRIQGVEDGDASKREPLLAYMRFEHEEDKTSYVLTGRQWYAFSKSYVDEVKERLEAIVMPYDGPPLKDWPKSYPVKRKELAKPDDRIGWYEDFYNLLYENEDNFMHLDRENYTMGEGGGHGQIEVCDFFYHPRKMHFCVKKENKAQTLSHLFAQASVSADMFRREARYRQEFIRRLKYRWPAQSQFFEDSEYLEEMTFVYCIALEDVSRTPFDSLPVFSKVNLLRNAADIDVRRHRVQICLIPLVERVVTERKFRTLAQPENQAPGRKLTKRPKNAK